MTDVKSFMIFYSGEKSSACCADFEEKEGVCIGKLSLIICIHSFLRNVYS